MSHRSLARYGTGIVAGIALLSGCSSNGTTPSAGSRLNDLVAMTNLAHQGIPSQHPLAHSWMHTPPKGTKATIYASDADYATVDLIAYPSGKLTGQIAGFSFPYGLCSDTQGNVYVADFSNETGYEIEAGTTSVINSWATGGETDGCSVSNGGDVAFTNFYPGGVIVFPGGGPSGTSYPGPGYDWPAGYDKDGHLFVECDYAAPCSSPHLAELSGSTWNLLNFDTTISFPGAVQAMGALLGVADQDANGNTGTGIYYTQVSGSDAHDVKTVLFKGSGSCPYTDWPASWGSISKKPNGVQSVKVKHIAATDSNCASGIGVWNAKTGGDPIKNFDPVSGEEALGTTFTR